MRGKFFEGNVLQCSPYDLENKQKYVNVCILTTDKLVAQWDKHRIGLLKVAGSNPSPSPIRGVSLSKNLRISAANVINFS